jgi:glycosyltransferase involved in cell wall biosynthesis
MFSQSLILTVHNKDFLLENVLESIKKNTIGNYELIVVLDGCSDKSESICFEFKNKNKNLNLKIIETPDVFETIANNAGLKQASGDISIIIQDDMIINESNWNNRLIKPFSIFDDVFAVTANCAHNWELNSNSKHLNSEIITDYEWSDILNHVDHANRNNTNRDQFSIRQCVNRGPLAINNLDLKSLNYLDESFAPLDIKQLRDIIASDWSIAPRFKDCEFLFEPRVLHSWSVSTDRFFGDGFVLTGNVTEFLDPVFSSGVTLATTSSQIASKLVIRQLNGEVVDWQKEYTDLMMQGVDTFRSYVLAWYDGTLQKIFFAEERNQEVIRQICSVLAGYVWDLENPYVKSVVKMKCGIVNL